MQTFMQFYLVVDLCVKSWDLFEVTIEMLG